MTLSPRLHLKAKQTLAMTPQLMQSIKLLQMTAVELEQFINQELEKNPLLERQDDEHSEPLLPDHHPLEKMPREEAADDTTHQEKIPDAVELSDSFDASLENIYPDDPGTDDNHHPIFRNDGGGFSGHYGFADDHDFLQNIAKVPSLREHIREQIILSFFDPQERLIATELADQLDDAGYFIGDNEDISQRLGLSKQRVDQMLEKMQGFEPAGLFARNLAECLALQLKAKNRFDPAMAIMLKHLPEVARRDFAFLKKVCHVSDDDLLDMFHEIRSLDPKPGTAFSTATADPVIPDILIEENRDGQFRIELNRAALPRLIVNNDYSMSHGQNAQEKTYLDSCLQNANWLLRALDQRAKTLIRVTSLIVAHQEAFLRHGIGFLRPLTLHEIADSVGLHESTISRITANKYVATPRGTFEMRSFFSIALHASEGGENHAADAVRHRIRTLIENESVDAILSDDTLVTLLQKENIDIARRTVAKYRESMDIASSVVRRREKKAYEKSKKK